MSVKSSVFFEENLQKLKIANTYLSSGLFDRAETAFLKLMTVSDFSKLASIGIKLCKYRIANIVVEDTIDFYNEVLKISCANADISFTEEIYKIILKTDGREFYPDEFLEWVIGNFKFNGLFDHEEAKSFVNRYSDSYLYYDLLVKISDGYLLDGKFDNACYFVEEARITNPNDSKALLNVLLLKTKRSRKEDIVYHGIALDQYEEFGQLLLICDDKERKEYVLLLKKQVENLNDIEIDDDEEERIEQAKKTLKFFNDMWWIFRVLLTYFWDIYGSVIRINTAILNKDKKEELIHTVGAFTFGWFGIVWILDLVSVIFTGKIIGPKSDN